MLVRMLASSRRPALEVLPDMSRRSVSNKSPLMESTAHSTRTAGLKLLPRSADDPISVAERPDITKRLRLTRGLNCTVNFADYVPFFLLIIIDYTKAHSSVLLRSRAWRSRVEKCLRWKHASKKAKGRKSYVQQRLGRGRLCEGNSAIYSANHRAWLCERFSANMRSNAIENALVRVAMDGESGGDENSEVRRIGGCAWEAWRNSTRDHNFWLFWRSRWKLFFSFTTKTKFY